MRYAVKVAYDGSLFHGSQRQGPSDKGSVEGAVGAALMEMGFVKDLEPWPVEFSSRTDTGVSALGNVFAFRTEAEPRTFLSALNANLEGIWCWAAGTIRDRQNVRWPEHRWYRYHLKPQDIGPDRVPLMREALSHFVGKHDMTHFCRLEEGKDPVLQIEQASVSDLSGAGEMVVVDIIGRRFLWQLVRRMVGISLQVARGEQEMATLESLLQGPLASEEALSQKYWMRTMPPTGLILMDVHFKDIDFRVVPEALDLAIERTSDAAWEASMKVLLHSAMRSLSSGLDRGRGTVLKEEPPPSPDA